MASYAHTFVSGETVTPAKLNNARTVSDIVNADVSASAAIAHTKLASIPAGQVLLGNASNIPTATALSGDVTVSNTGTVTIANNAVTSAKLSSSIVFVPAGAVMPFAMNTAPSGWLAADGSAVSRTTYASLFTAIGTTHGAGNGSTTFNLPDLRGYFIRGFGTNSDDGTASAAFGVKQADAFQSHGHDVKIAGGLAGFQSFTGPGFTGVVPQAGTIAADANDSKLVAENIVTFSGGTPRTASETRPANIALLYCIKF